MATEARLQNLALHVRNLLECDEVSLCLCCPEPALRHPLLALFASKQKRVALYYGSLIDPVVLSNEHIWAVCDLAMQSGRGINSGELPERKDTACGTPAIRSIAVAVLERPAGVLGFLFCTSRQTGAFQPGEHRLLTQYLPMLARQVEQALSDDSTGMDTPDRTRAIVTDVQEQNAFISMVSHELRVPLTAIKGYAGLLQAYGGSDPTEEDQTTALNATRRQQYLNVIMEQTSHLEVLIGDVLDVSRIQSGRLALHCTQIDLAQLCHSVAQLMQYRIDQQQPGRYRILCTFDPGLPSAWADPDRVQQILTNLVENAIKYSPDGGLIEVLACIHPTCILQKAPVSLSEQQSASDAPLVSVTVRDSGIGISHEQQPSLFKPFSRLEHPATRHVSGVGLGLYIARKLVEAMHGQLQLQSSEGQGTSITFTLPASSVNRLPPAYSLPVSVSL
jgi:signal transduction histidine kinase